ncbi:hypothetical protein [Phytohabitans aurantiacus]|jgi:hypothetical protein|nr:hypothetical protein [Phytohabitans aurantiacus]
MSEEILGKLQRVQQEVNGLRDLMAKLRAHAPQGSEGSDSTGQIRVSIAADGLPTAIRVESAWRGRLGPESVGQAVLDAFTAAVVSGMRAWEDALDAMSWRSRVAELEAQAELSRDRNGPALPPPMGGDFDTAGDATEVAEDALRAADRLRKQSTGEPPVGVGTDPPGNVSVTLSSAGLQACAVKAAWASRQDGKTLTTALTTALRNARTALDAQAKQPNPDAFSQLVGEALTALRSVAKSSRRDAR